MSEEVNKIIRQNKIKRQLCMSESQTKREVLSPKLRYVKNLITRFLVSIILVLLVLIGTNTSDNNKKIYQEYVLTNSLEFTKINNLYQNLFGKVDILKKNNSDKTVFFNSLNYTNMENYKNGVKLTVGINEAINVITSGIVVFIGEKEDLGNTIIIQGNDGVDIWYSNITDTDISIYDYVESGSIIGTSNSDYLYLTINKDGKYISYEEYKKSL